MKILVWLALGFFVLLAPLSSTIYLSGPAYAKGNDNSQGDNNNQGENDQGNTRARTPEPATWLLVGLGVAGAALVRKKFRK